MKQESDAVVNDEYATQFCLLSTFDDIRKEKPQMHRYLRRPEPGNEAMITEYHTDYAMTKGMCVCKTLIWVSAVCV